MATHEALTKLKNPILSHTTYLYWQNAQVSASGFVQFLQKMNHSIPIGATLVCVVEVTVRQKNIEMTMLVGAEDPQVKDKLLRKLILGELEEIKAAVEINLEENINLELLQKLITDLQFRNEDC